MIRENPEFGITYEKDDITYWVTMSEELEDLATELEHPLCDEHYCHGIDEVWWRLQEMVEFGKEHYPKVISQ
jgi:hypothetical protein